LIELFGGVRAPTQDDPISTAEGEIVLLKP
jgi:hypothetical protein